MDPDVVVSGAGVIGAATALALHSQGYRVLLIEASSPNATTGRLGYDLRTLALTPANVDWLAKLGVPESHLRQEIKKMHVWEQVGSGSVSFDPQRVGLNALGWIFEHHPLLEVLRTLCQQELTLKENSRIVAIDNLHRTLSLSDGEEIKCRFLCIAEGQNSQTRSLAGANINSDRLGHSALVTVARTENGHRATAWQKFGQGILALLPLPDGECVSIIWSLTDDLCNELMTLEESNFCNRLEKESESVCGKIVEVDERKTFPLSQAVVNTFNPQPWIAIVGDAAHTIHPLAGQGVNLGLEDARALVHLTETSDFRQVGYPELANFARMRKLRALTMIQLMSFLLNTWSWNDPITRWIRNVGIRSFNRTPILKHQAIREAMGLGPLGRLV